MCTELDGHWKLGNGDRVKIEGTIIHAYGPPVEFIILETDSKIQFSIDGKTYIGKVNVAFTVVEWNDGDVWTKIDIVNDSFFYTQRL